MFGVQLADVLSGRYRNMQLHNISSKLLQVAKWLHLRDMQCTG